MYLTFCRAGPPEFRWPSAISYLNWHLWSLTGRFRLHLLATLAFLPGGLIKINVFQWNYIPLPFISANSKCEVPEGDLHPVRHKASAGVQQHPGGSAQGGLPGAETQGMLRGLWVSQNYLLNWPQSLVLRFLSICSIVEDTRYTTQCESIVQHVCEEHYKVTLT